jgi:DNA-binding response OmpR family regulator
VALEKRIILFGHLVREGPDLAQLLIARGFRVYPVANEVDLIEIMSVSQPDVLLLVGATPLPLLARIVTARGGGQSLVVVLWPGASVSDAINVLDAGADFIAVTFQPDLLAGQIRALLRRVGRERLAPSVIDLGFLRIDLQQRRVSLNDREVSLTRTEFDVLRVLAERPGTVLPSGEIMQQVIGVHMPETEAQDLLKVHVHRLRQKLEPDHTNPRLIRTVRGHGYMYAFERRSKERMAPATAAG